MFRKDAREGLEAQTGVSQTAMMETYGALETKKDVDNLLMTI